ncbi:MAG: hypothetical protein JWM11_3796 [Planctomycetaceae bacterium]|nr:hypothetical protein [Planctomycetaceae bacterium]
MSNSNSTSGVDQANWDRAAGHAQEAVVSAGTMACHIGSAVGAMASQAACEVGKTADDLTACAGVGIQGLGDRLSKNVPQDGMLGNASQAIARTIKGSGEYVEGAKLSGMTEDVAHVIRRNPITAILIATGLGWFVGHKLRG